MDNCGLKVKSKQYLVANINLVGPIKLAIVPLHKRARPIHMAAHDQNTGKQEREETLSGEGEN